MVRPKTRSGRLSDLARHVVLPDGIATTGWPAVRDKCAEFGDSFDEWQDGAGRAILAKRADGKYAATVGGVTLSIPRQVAKTFLVGRIIFALCVIFPGLKVVWTAHRSRTCTNTFRALQAYAKRKKIAPLVDHIRTTNGEQEIVFRNGSLIMFGAREQGFGRGFDEIDVEVFDEAQILTEKALEDMVAATNQSRHPHGALLFYMGTPPRPVDPGEAFSLKRAKALLGTLKDGVYIEFSADPDADPDDRAQWAKANPSYPNRTPLESMLRLRENLPSDDAWRREALGIWDSRDLSFEAAYSLGADPDSAIEGRPVFAISMSKDLQVALLTAGKRSDGKWHVEVVESGHVNGLYGKLGEPRDRTFAQRVAQVVKDAGSRVWLCPNHPVGSLQSALADEKCRVETLNGTEYAQSCVALYKAFLAGDVKYPPPQESLERAVKSAVQRKSGDTWKWDGDGITSLVAASQALFAAQNAPAPGKGRAVLLAQ